MEIIDIQVEKKHLNFYEKHIGSYNDTHLQYIALTNFTNC